MGGSAILKIGKNAGKISTESVKIHMAREFSRAFYHSKAWKKTREAYIKERKGLCERHLRMGELVPGNTVHHKIHLNEQNIDDPSITLSFDNLELLCPDCHAFVHRGDKKGRHIDVDNDEPPRVLFDENGNVIRRDNG